MVASSEEEDKKEHRFSFEPVIEFVARGIAFRVRKFALKRQVSCILYGEKPNEPGVPVKVMDQHAYETLRRKARELMQERASVNFEEAKQDSVNFYEEIIVDEKIHAKTRIRAQENLDKIHNVTESEGVGVDQVAAAAIAALAAVNGMMMEKPNDESAADRNTDPSLDKT